MPQDDLGAWIRLKRKELGINQTQLGAQLGLNQAQISQLETGKIVPTAVVRQRLQELFGRPAETLELEPSPSPDLEPEKQEETKTVKRRPANSKTTTSDYRHEGEKRTNIPPAKIAAEGTVPKVPKAKYAYNPHLPPVLRFDAEGKADRIQDLIAEAGRRQLSGDERKLLAEALSHHQPWLEWAGKREEHEKRFFEVDPVALHIHERVSAQAIVRAAMREDVQRGLFADPEQPYHEAVQFYKHDMDWANRLILGDCQHVMSSLARRENLAGKVQMIYIDPPYGIRFSKNFQPFVRSRDVKETEKDFSREPEMVRAYRDTWNLGIHSYLEYLTSRLCLMRELLCDSGSVFLQISDDNLHLVRQVMDDVFGIENFVVQIAFYKTSSLSAKTVPKVVDYLLHYAKDIERVKARQLSVPKKPGERGAKQYTKVVSPDLTLIRNMTTEEIDGSESIPEGWRICRIGPSTSEGYQANRSDEYIFEGRPVGITQTRHWSYDPAPRGGMDRLYQAGRLRASGTSLATVLIADDNPVTILDNVWLDTGTGSFTEDQVFVVQTPEKVIERCLLMTTDPGDLVLDPTCGGGTTAVVAEKWGRRWITIDTSRVALALTRQRVLTAKFPLFQVKHGDPIPGCASHAASHVDPSRGFECEIVPHITLGSIANNRNLDPIFAKHEPILEQRLADCNRALRQVGSTPRQRLLGKLRGKQAHEGKRAITDADRRRWELPQTRFEHWTVPFDTDRDWPQALRDAVKEYRKAWRAKMDEVNACIAANADQEELVDQPEVVKGVVRVSGPFTVEGVMPEELSVGEEGLFDGTPNEFVDEVAEDAQTDLKNLSAYLHRMVQLLRQDGVTFPNNKHRDFARLEGRFEDASGGLIHADGQWRDDTGEKPARVAVSFGPQYGPVTAKQVEDVIHEAKWYDEVVIAGFSFDAEAWTAVHEAAHPKKAIHAVQIRPDVNPAMEGLLKDTPNSQLFTVFGQPEIEVRTAKGGEFKVKLVGVDIYDPLTSEVRSTGASKVAAWFLDSDFDGRCFCITQAFFPDQDAWEKIAKALGSAADPDAFEAFNGTTSLPFKPGKHHRIAVKVIDPRGNEVMAIRKLEG